MKKKIVYILLGACTLFAATSCSDFLETSSPSDTDVEFVFSDPSTARAALKDAYETWRASASVHSNGLFYDLVICGSDSERHPEAYASQARHAAENLYAGGTGSFNIDTYAGAWSNLYAIIATSNTLINSFEASTTFKEYMSAGQPSQMSQLYGEAVALRATIYMELIRFYGDVPHQLMAGVSAEGLTSRDEIYEYHLNKLIEVEPLMFRVGENSVAEATIMTRTYVQGLIGRICLYAGGYSTRRTDLGADFYKGADGKALTFTPIGAESNGAIYNRRTDYLEFYKTAKTYLSACVANPGTVKLVTTDPRSTSETGQVFNNPYQYVFQQMNDLVVADESIYEIPETQGIQSERPYAFGRPSNGGGSNAYPCKSYGQSRFHPSYYYGDFDPNDLRRDVTATITASTGKGTEVMIDFQMNSKSSGGISNNKWDENRMSNPFITKQRQSGIKTPYLRFSDVVLMLAEVEAELGNEGQAKTELQKVHNRAFASPELANLDGFIAKCGGLKAAILEERKLEFGGEGIRRYDLIRTGTLPEAVTKLRAQLLNMVNGLEAKGYYTFDNGNTISKYIWTKSVDAAAQVGHRLTTQCTDNTNPVLFPGWRGQHNDWEAVSAKFFADESKRFFYDAAPKTNIAIKGLFEYIDPNGAVAAALEADGYKKTNWGSDIVANKAEYSTRVFCGFEAGKAPIYLVPMSVNTISTSNGKLTNGYGFAQK